MTIISTEARSINDSVKNLPPVMYSGLPVITTELLAHLYGTDTDNIKKNYGRNVERFTEGKHYFKLTGDELRELKRKVTDCPFVKIAANVRHLMLWTERGAARHAKMLETDQAWDVFEKLEDFYFNQKEATEVKPKIRRSTATQLTPLRQAAERLITTGIGKIYPDIWKLVHERFSIEHIHQLEPTQITEAIEFLNVLEGEYIAKEEYSVPVTQQQLSDDELIALCWSWHYLMMCRSVIEDIYPLLDVAEHKLAKKFYSIPKETACNSGMVQSILKRLTAHLEPSNFDNSRILNNLRRESLTK